MYEFLKLLTDLLACINKYCKTDVGKLNGSEKVKKDHFPADFHRIYFQSKEEAKTLKFHSRPQVFI